MSKLATLATSMCLLLAACGGSKDGAPAAGGASCLESVSHAQTLIMKQGAGASAPGAGEIAAMEANMKAAVAACQAEGLSQAQRDCILGATSWEQFTALGECPAIKAKKPSWLLIP